MFDKKDYYKLYFNKGYRKFEDRLCVICGCKMYVPSSVKAILTCCEYCKKVRLAIQKSKGKYVLCRVCNKAIWCQPKKTHQFCSINCKDIGTSIFTSERNITRGTYKKYYGENWITQRDKARKRDNYTCQRCGIQESKYGKQMSVHHITPFLLFKSYIEANKLSNLLCVCEPCHRKIHSGNLHHTRYISR